MKYETENISVSDCMNCQLTGFRINSVLRKCIFEGNQFETLLLNFLERLYRYLATLSNTTISIHRQMSKNLLIVWKNWPFDDIFNANNYFNRALCHYWYRNAPSRYHVVVLYKGIKSMEKFIFFHF